MTRVRGQKLRATPSAVKPVSLVRHYGPAQLSSLVGAVTSPWGGGASFQDGRPWVRGGRTQVSSSICVWRKCLVWQVPSLELAISC